MADADLLKPWQLEREKYKARKKAVGNREKDTLARLSKFTAALRWAVGQWGGGAVGNGLRRIFDQGSDPDADRYK